MESDKKKFDVFISYSRADSILVRDFYNRLVAEGFRVWIDTQGIEPGDLFKAEIASAIRDSRSMVFFSSHHSNTSEWTAKEIGVAVKRKLPIFPVWLDNSDYNELVEFDLVNLDATDYTRPDERKKSLERFIVSLKKKIPCPTTQSSGEPKENQKHTLPDNNKSVGDLVGVYGAKSIVVNVDPIKKEYTVVALLMKTACWEQYGLDSSAFFTNSNDGAVNQSSFKSIGFKNYPALQWCDSLGPNWYIPSINELKGIMKKISMIEKALGQRFNRDYPFCSSTECGKGRVESINFRGEHEASRHTRSFNVLVMAKVKV